ncbi:MAG: RidA family protein [Firmicutes bacterium]|nr:RidA family protein [Bacillota bacterium]
MGIRDRLRALGMELPAPPSAVAAYLPAVRIGPLVYTSGQLPFHQGKLLAEGRVNREVTVDAAYHAARQCALNALSVAGALLGDVDHIRRVIKVVGFVQSAEDFHGQPQVINGASDFFYELMGEAGQHARSAVGVIALPLNAAVEVEVIFETDLQS